MSNRQKTVIFALMVLFLSSLLLAYQADDALMGLFPKNLVAPVSVYRFFNTVQGGHLYTISTIERDYIIDNFPEWNYEGTKFKVCEALAPGTAATYRFFNTITGIHLYTISEIERDYIIDNLPEWNYEGVKFYVSENLSAYTTAVYRFFNHVRGGHLYTISEIERDAVMQLPDWTYEGVPFYVYPLGRAHVPRTGQTISYRDGDDGDLQMGVQWPTPRFTDHGDGTVTDNLTGLMWTKNANMDGQKNWDDAIDWCNGLTHGGYSDWRLPNQRELHSLIDKGRYNSGLPDGHPFTDVQNSDYWSSSTYAGGTGSAWQVNIGWAYSWYDPKSGTRYVWAVRGVAEGIAPVPVTGQTTTYRAGDDGYYQMGVQWPEPRFTDHGNGTVTDNLTGLMWSKNANIDGTKNWNDAIDWCNGLDHAGYSDWRLPNLYEMFSLIDLARINPALMEGDPFTGVQSSLYWSSTTNASSTDYAWIVFMYGGDVNGVNKTHTHSVWPVRSGQ